MSWTKTLRSAGHRSTGPSGVRVQSKDRMRDAISPFPVGHAGPCFSVPFMCITYFPMCNRLVCAILAGANSAFESEEHSSGHRAHRSILGLARRFERNPLAMPNIGLNFRPVRGSITGGWRSMGLYPPFQSRLGARVLLAGGQSCDRRRDDARSLLKAARMG